jgi:SAM-dependent methyltransferase
MAGSVRTPTSPVPYAFECIDRQGGGVELERLEAQNRFLEKHGLMAQLPPVPQAGHILDLGAGPGYWSMRLASLVPAGQVICLDRSPELLGHAQTRMEKAGILNATFLRQDVRELDLPLGTLDLVFTSVILVHVVEVEEVLTRLHGALKPGGWFACFEPAHQGDTFMSVHPPSPNLEWLARAMVEEGRALGSDFAVAFRIAAHLERLGLTNLSVRYFGEAARGEDARSFVRDVFLPFARAYLAPRLVAADLDRRLEAALGESLQPGLWIDYRRTVVLGRKGAPPSG